MSTTQTSGLLQIVGLGDLAGKNIRIKFSFWAIVLLTFFLFADQQLVAPNLSRIGADFGFPEKEDYTWYIGSVVTIMFFVVGGAVSVGIGVASDVYDRKKLLIFTTLLGACAYLASALAPNYGWFLFFR